MHFKDLKSKDPALQYDVVDILNLTTGPKQSLDDVDMEDNKRDIIHREIDKFREIMKLREAEKEEEKKKRDKDTDKVTSETSSSKRERSKVPYYINTFTSLALDLF